MADNTGNARSENKPVRTGSLLVRLLLFLLDVFLTLFLFSTPFLSFGAYISFLLPEFGIGVLYVIIRLILKNVEQTNFTNHCYIALRIFGVTVAAIYCIVLMNFGNSFSWFYPIRKTLYIAGNYSNSEYFDFLPDKIPDKADKFGMRFVAPIYAPESLRLIQVCFYTDETGINEWRSSAESKGGILCGADDIVYSKISDVCEAEGYELADPDIYKIDHSGINNALTAYVISETTGFCMVYWME